MKIKLKIKRIYYVILCLLLIFFLFSLFISIYLKKVNPKIINLSKISMQNMLYNAINDSVYESISKSNVNDILKIYQNSDQEIIYVDYDLNQTYEILNLTTKLLKEKLNTIEKMYLSFPILISSDYALLNNLGPKVNVKINYVNAIITNIYTKITDYGLNNALVEAYIKISVEGKIITPVSDDNKVITHDVLIASKVINGKVPVLYGDYLTKDSSFFNVPIE